MTMSSWKSLALAGTIALLSPAAPAWAEPEEAPAAEVVADDSMLSESSLADAKTRMRKEMDEAIALVEKIFATDTLPPIDPAQLALAQQTTAALIPAGSLERMLDNLYGKVFKSIMAQVDGASDLMIGIKTGVDSDTIAALDAPSKQAIADLFDPHRKQREEQVTAVIKPVISEVLADLEPPMRAGLARAYARTFAADQLGQFNAFFATPAGQAYAREWMALQADPEVMLAMIKAVPPLADKVIDRAPQIEGQLNELPKERALADLSDAELRKLAKLLKVDVKTLKETRDSWNASGEMVDVAASDEWSDSDDAVDAAVDAAAAAADDYDAGHDRSNWSEADRKAVEELEAATHEAEQTAAANARKRLGMTDPTS